MPGCDKIIEGLWLYLDKEMGEQDVIHFKAHLDLCRGCFDRVEFEVKLRDHMRCTTNHPCPDAVKNKIKKLLDQF